MKSLVKSFGYAFRGIWYALKYERNMRIHFTCMVYMYTFLAVYDFFTVTRTQFAVLFFQHLMPQLLFGLYSQNYEFLILNILYYFH